MSAAFNWRVFKLKAQISEETDLKFLVYEINCQSVRMLKRYLILLKKIGTKTRENINCVLPDDCAADSLPSYN
jgi:hypothetical protein